MKLRRRTRKPSTPWGAVARRQSDAAWRLVGLRIQSSVDVPRPCLEAFAQQDGLEIFSKSEVLKLYAAAFPADRKAARGQGLRERQLELLRRLERLAADTPQPSDLVAGWFEELLAVKLARPTCCRWSALTTASRRAGAVCAVSHANAFSCALG